MARHHRTRDVLDEKGRIGKLSLIRELVFGAQDGLMVPLGVISSVAGAFNNNHIVLIAGISEALAGAFSMATGAYLSSKAEKQVYDTEIKKETKHILRHPDAEKEELTLILKKEGMSTSDSKNVANILARNSNAFTKIMINLELGIDPDPTGTPTGDALFVGASYLISAAIPLLPYFFISGIHAIISSIVLTLIALFGIGIAKAKFTLLPYLRSGLEVLLIGAGAGLGGYFLGTILPSIIGIK